MQLPESYRDKKFRFYFETILSEVNRKAYYSLCVLFGLLIFFLYFSHIGYVPRISLTDSAVLLFSAIFVGIVFTVCLAGLFILPTIVLALSIYAISGSEMVAYARIGVVSSVVGWLIFLLLNGDWKEFGCNVAAGLVNFVVMVLCAVMLFSIARHGAEGIKDVSEKENLTFTFFLGSMAALLFCNMLITSIENLKSLHVLVGSLLLLLSVLLAARSWAVIPKGVMNTLGLGSFRAYELLISGETCAYFKGQPYYEAVGDSDDLCKLKKPWVLWNGEETTLIRYGNLKYLLPREQTKLLISPVAGA